MTGESIWFHFCSSYPIIVYYLITLNSILSYDIFVHRYSSFFFAQICRRSLILISRCILTQRSVESRRLFSRRSLRALFHYLSRSFRHSRSGLRPLRPSSSFFFLLAATRSPTGLLPEPTVDPDAPTFLAYADAVANTGARACATRFPGSEKRNADTVDD